MKRRDYKIACNRAISAFHNAEDHNQFWLRACKIAFCREMSKYISYSKAMFYFFNRMEVNSHYNGNYGTSIQVSWIDMLSCKTPFEKRIKKYSVKSIKTL
jgi:hypothetical protein